MPSPRSSPGVPGEEDNQNARWLAAIIFSILSLTAAISSKGFLEADACTHYIYARHVFEEPNYLIDIWGRPVCTGWYAIPAHLAGRLGVRITSLLMALGIAAISYRIAKLQQYRWPALAFIFVLAQPLVFLHSFSELTELPFALLIGVAFLAYRERRWWEFALVAGVLPLSRPEGFGFILLAFAALLIHRRWWWISLLLLPVLFWDWAGWQFYGQKIGNTPGPWWKWLIAYWPYAAQSIYDRGSPFRFTVAMPAVVGPFIFPALVIGSWLNTRISNLKVELSDNAHRRRCDFLIAFIALTILVVHSLLYWRGKMASSGELRYMLTAAPFWALLANRGWAWAFERFNWNHALRWAGIAALSPALVNIIYPTIPIKLHWDWQQAQRIAHWYQSDPSLHDRYPRILGSHPGIWYFLNISPTNPDHALYWSPENIDKAPPGTVLIWDPIFGLKNADARLSISLEKIRAAGWIEVRDTDSIIDHYEDEEPWHIFLSPAPLAP